MRRKNPNLSTVTIKEAAGLLGVSEPTLRRWDRLGKLPARRSPFNGYRLYDRRQILDMRMKMARPRVVDLPVDFPNLVGNRDVAIVDTLIVMLFEDRELLLDPTWRAAALARIERARSAIMPFGNAPHSAAVRLEMLVRALDRSAELKAPIENRVTFFRILVEEAMPTAKLGDDLVRDAVRLWPERRQTEARVHAVRDLARALQCDTPSLMTLLRAARKRIRERTKAARRN